MRGFEIVSDDVKVGDLVGNVNEAIVRHLVEMGHLLLFQVSANIREYLVIDTQLL